MLTLTRATPLRRWSFILTCLACSGCVPEQERTPYGPPSILGSRKVPDPEGDTTVTPPPPAGDGAAVCGEPVEADMDCAVQWSTDLFPLIRDAPGNAATMKCSAGGNCHGTGTTLPVIDNDDPKRAWEQLTLFTKASLGGDTKPYINRCSKDDQASSITCNLSAAGSCGTFMPQTGAAGLPEAPAEFMEKLKTWLQCGAPNN